MSNVAASGSAERLRPVRVDDAFREQVHRAIVTFLAEREGELRAAAPDAAELIELAVDFVQGGKKLRSTFAYLGWLTRRPDSLPALRAAASLELLHAFALMQDDVMDRSTTRRGRPCLHETVQHRHHGIDQRFGESAATVLGDLCLIWSEQMLRTSGLDEAALRRANDCYDAMRQELAVGQYLDLLYTHRENATRTDALRTALLKSARYTVTRPLQLGARLAGGDDQLHRDLAAYGDAIGQAIQIRDDILGVTGDPVVMGKPTGDDLRAGKRTTVVATALELADPVQERTLRTMLGDRAAAQHSAALVDALLETGAIEHLEQVISEQLTRAEASLQAADITPEVATELRRMARRCADRVS
ncbi:polyprenyl synthetase family protein [Allosaccharopolyspora coralli]|nr:polyprenyl synthetase family protein [Allosaccharopolyspora coralli]